MSKRRLLKFIPLFIFTAFLISGPSGTASPAHAANQATTTTQAKNIFKGKILGVSKKAKTISIKVGKKTELVKFDANTKGMEHAIKGHGSIIKFDKHGNDKIATIIKAKLAKLPKGVTEMMPEELAKLIALGPDQGKYFLVDSRPAGRFHEGHIRTAVNIPVAKMKKTGSSYLPGNAKIDDIQLIFYCGGPT